MKNSKIGLRHVLSGPKFGTGQFNLPLQFESKDFCLRIQEFLNILFQYPFLGFSPPWIVDRPDS